MRVAQRYVAVDQQRHLRPRVQGEERKGVRNNKSCKSNLKPCLRRAAPAPSTFTNHIAADTQDMLLGSAH